MKQYEKYVKRPLDIVISSMAIIVLSPVILITGLSVRKKIGKPVIFCQPRPGRVNKCENEKIFNLYKFRTMTNDCDKSGKLLSDEMRLTDFGEWLRRTSLDELPELYNVLKGDMSLVGPRPQLVRDMVFMNDRERKRHSVRPGITGLAQINGRNSISWSEKIDYDLEYIKDITLKNDLKILIQTIASVLREENINEEGKATATDYGDYLLENNIIEQTEYYIKLKEAEALIMDYNNTKKKNNNKFIKNVRNQHA